MVHFKVYTNTVLWLSNKKTFDSWGVNCGKLKNYRSIILYNIQKWFHQSKMTGWQSVPQKCHCGNARSHRSSKGECRIRTNMAEVLKCRQFSSCFIGRLQFRKGINPSLIEVLNFLHKFILCTVAGSYHLQQLPVESQSQLHCSFTKGRMQSLRTSSKRMKNIKFAKEHTIKMRKIRESIKKKKKDGRVLSYIYIYIWEKYIFSPKF